MKLCKLQSISHNFYKTKLLFTFISYKKSFQNDDLRKLSYFLVSNIVDNSEIGRYDLLFGLEEMRYMMFFCENWVKLSFRQILLSICSF